MTDYTFHGGLVARLDNEVTGKRAQGQSVDRFGNLWLVPGGILFDAPIQCIGPDGTLLQNLTRSGLINQVCVFAQAHQAPATSWAASGFTVEDSGEGGHVVTEGGQSYLIFTHTQNQGGFLHFDQSVSVWNIAAGGVLTLLAVCWSFGWSGTSQFNSSVYKIDLLGQKTLDDPIFVAYGLSDDTQAPAFKIFPSVNEIIANVASAVNTPWYFWPGWPGSAYDVGNTYHSLAINQPGLGVNADLDQACFVMPHGGDNDLLIYTSKAMMDATTVSYVTANLKPSYPNGCLARLTLPAPSYSFTSGTPSAPLEDILDPPAAVAGAFIDASGTPYDAFSDVGVYYDGTSGAAGFADYFDVPRIVEREDSGAFVVAWYHPWFQDTSYTPLTNWTFKARLRLQRYDPTTGLFTDLQIIEGSVASVDDVGTESPFGSADYMDVLGWGLWNDGKTLFVWNFNGPSADGSARYVTWLGSMATEAAQVTVHTRIGAR